MTRARAFLSSPFGSALLGGLVVAIAGLIAIEAGLVDDDEDSPSLGSGPLTKPASAGGGKGLTVNEIYDRHAQGVVFIRAQRTEQVASPFDLLPQEQRSTASGSGFVIDQDGHILTNAHVVQGAERIDVQIDEEGESRRAELVGTDPSTDLALIRVDDPPKALELGDSSQVDVGDPVVAIGNPFGLDRTVTTGIVSALQREIQAPNGFSITDVIQTDAAINPGNSGGPLLDASGRVIGINSQIATSGGGSEGVGFAVPIATAREVVEQLRGDGKIERAYLGMTGADITAEVAQALQLPVEQGVLVERAFEGGPADEAGLRGATGQVTMGGLAVPSGGDIIIEVAGEPVKGMNDVIAAVDDRNPGDELTLTILRNGSEQEISVTLGNRPSRIADAAAPAQP